MNDGGGLTRLRRKGRAALVALVLSLLPLLAIAGGLGIATAMAILGIGVALLGLTKRGAGERQGLPSWFWAVFAFAFWALVTSSWSRYPVGEGWDILASNPAKLLFGAVIFTVAAGGILHTFDADHKGWVRHLALAAFVATLGACFVDLANGYALSYAFDPVAPGADPNLRRRDAEMNVGHGLTVALLLLPAALLGLWRATDRFGRAVRIAAVVAPPLVLLASGFLSGLWVIPLGIAVVAVFMALAWRWPNGGVVAAFATASASLILAPLVGRAAAGLSESQQAALPFSWEHRVEGWAHVTEYILERPLIGHGFDAVRTMDATANIRGYEMNLVSLHPHNAGLHIWVETGVIGVGLAVLALIALSRYAVDWVDGDRVRGSAVAGCTAAALTVSAISYGVWQEWWWATLFLSAALIPVMLDERP